METISTEAIRIHALIQACVDEFGPRYSAQQECNLEIAFKDFRGRFRSWCGHVGMSQPENATSKIGNASLHPYIHEHDRRQQSILRFIKNLAVDLEHCKSCQI
jgi:hypothetical protein